MSYLKAEEILPKELIEQIQEYVSGKSIYIPCKEKKIWGSETESKDYYKARNLEILRKYQDGETTNSLAKEYSLSIKSIQRIIRRNRQMDTYSFVTLREKKELKDAAAEWFHNKWGVPKEAYLECIESYLKGETENGWYLCLDGSKIVGGLGVIDNDFHNRKDLTPNVCAVYTEEEYRKQGISGKLLNLVVDDMKSKGISPIYLITDHIGFYERYGWEFLCMVQGDDEPEMTRMYIHR